MNRGLAFQGIFPSNKYRILYLDILKEASEMYGIQIHNYCLMDNHYHLLLKTPFGNISRAMRHINGVYTQRFNRLEQRDGPLFRGRYKAILIDSDAYLLQVSRYIHLNPHNANLDHKLKLVSWSSLPYFIERKKSPKWLCTQFIESLFCGKNRKEKYQKFIEQGIDKETEKFYKNRRHSTIFGSKKFVRESLSHITKKQIKDSSTDYKRTAIKVLPTEIIIEQCSSYFDVSKNELFHTVRGTNNYPRKIALYLCRFLTHASTKDIAEKFKSSSPA